MQLTSQQVNFFNTFGFLHMPALFNQNETNRIIEEFELSINSVGDGKNHDGTKRTMFGGPIDYALVPGQPSAVVSADDRDHLNGRVARVPKTAHDADRHRHRVASFEEHLVLRLAVAPVN